DLAEIDAGASAAGEQEDVIAKLAAGNGARYRHAGRAAVAEEVAGLEGIVAGLIGHLLIAAARQGRTKQYARNQPEAPARVLQHHVQRPRLLTPGERGV